MSPDGGAGPVRMVGGPHSELNSGPDSALVYDPEWDEDARLTEWRGLIAATAALPTVLRAAVLMDAWQDIEVL